MKRMKEGKEKKILRQSDRGTVENNMKNDEYNVNMFTRFYMKTEIKFIHSLSQKENAQNIHFCNMQLNLNRVL